MDQAAWRIYRPPLHERWTWHHSRLVRVERDQKMAGQLSAPENPRVVPLVLAIRCLHQYFRAASADA